MNETWVAMVGARGDHQREDVLRTLAARLGYAMRKAKPHLSENDSVRFLSLVQDVLDDIGMAVAPVPGKTAKENMNTAPRVVRAEVDMLTRLATRESTTATSMASWSSGRDLSPTPTTTSTAPSPTPSPSTTASSRLPFPSPAEGTDAACARPHPVSRNLLDEFERAHFDVYDISDDSVDLGAATTTCDAASQTDIDAGNHIVFDDPWLMASAASHMLSTMLDAGALAVQTRLAALSVQCRFDPPVYDATAYDTTAYDVAIYGVAADYGDDHLEKDLLLLTERALSAVGSLEDGVQFLQAYGMCSPRFFNVELGDIDEQWDMHWGERDGDVLEATMPVSLDRLSRATSFCLGGFCAEVLGCSRAADFS